MPTEEIATTKEINMIKEYDYLKAEIYKKMDAHQTLVMFAITTTVAIYAWELVNTKPYLYLLPFFVLIPVSFRINWLRASIAKISAYLIVNIEKQIDGLEWETQNNFLYEKYKAQPVSLVSTPVVNQKNWECLFLGVASTVLYLLNTYSAGENQEVDFLINNAWLLIPLSILFVITITPRTPDQQRAIWIDRWREMGQPNIVPMENLLDKKVNEIMKIYLVQMLPLFVFFIADLFVDNTPTLQNLIVTIVQNIVYIITIFVAVVISRRASTSVFGTKEKAAIFLSQMFTIFLCFVVEGLFGSTNSYFLASHTMSLYLGFSVSLECLIDAKGFISCFTNPYKEANLSKKDWGVITAFNVCVLLFVSLYQLFNLG